MMMQQSELKIRDFLPALRSTYQSHLARYIENDEYTEMGSNDRSLSEPELNKIRDRYSFLVEHIDLHCGLLDALHVVHCFSVNHVTAIEQLTKPNMKIDMLIEILIRRSFTQYRLFLMCLIETNQHDVMRALDMNGVMTSVDVILGGRNSQCRDKLQKQIVKLFKRRMNSTNHDKTLDELLGILDVKLAGLAYTDSDNVRAYFICETLDALFTLRQLFDSGLLKNCIETVLNYLTIIIGGLSQPVRVKYISLCDYCKAEDNFHKLTQPVISSPGYFQLTILSTELLEQVLLKTFLILYANVRKTTCQPEQTVYSTLTSVYAPPGECYSHRSSDSSGRYPDNLTCYQAESD